MAQLTHNGTTYEVSDVEAFNKKQNEGGEKGDHVTKFTIEDEFDSDFVEAVATVVGEEFVLEAAGVTITVEPYDSSIVVQETLNQMTGEDVEVFQIALITESYNVTYN